MKRICSFAGCKNPYKGHGYCNSHLFQKKNNQQLRPLRKYGQIGCIVSNCRRSHDGKGYCTMHLRKFNLYGDPEKFADPLETSKKISANLMGKTKGKIVTKSTREKLRLKNLGKKQSEETKKKRSLSMLGNKNSQGIKQSEETIAKRIAKVKGQKRTPEQKKRMSKAQKGLNLGKKQSEETKKKKSESLKGHIVTKSTREKLRLKNLGKKLSEETKKKISKSGLGRKQSEKTIAKRIIKLKGQKRSKEFSENLSKRMKGRIVSDVTRKKQSEKAKIASNRPERKALQKEIFKKSRKNMARPNIPEKAIGKILEEIGIKVKFLQDIDYKNLEGKITSKEMDIFWKDSDGTKKIIEYNGRYHFDNRNHKSDEIHIVHGKPTRCHDIWDEENMILNQIRKAGYQILVVWEKDFQNDTENETKKILKFAKS